MVASSERDIQELSIGLPGNIHVQVSSTTSVGFQVLDRILKEDQQHLWLVVDWGLNTDIDSLFLYKGPTYSSVMSWLPAIAFWNLGPDVLELGAHSKTDSKPTDLTSGAVFKVGWLP